MGMTSWENIWFLKYFLANLELVSGLKVNRGKCSLFGLNLEEGIIDEFADFLGCRAGLFPFPYLSVMGGSSHRKTSDW
ncbi:hypothetical protein ACS0TY_034980 [Phlomoides rotata]